MTEGRRKRMVGTGIVVGVIVALAIAWGVGLRLNQGRRSGSARPERPRPAQSLPASSPTPAPSFPPEAVYPGFQPSGVAFWDTQHGLIVGGLAKGVPYRDCFSCRGLIAATQDGGRNWRVIKPLGHPWATSVVTGPAGDAWVTLANCSGCSSEAVLRTADGGHTWLLLRASAHSISFASASEGWAVMDHLPLFGIPGRIEHTVDGGERWTILRVPCAGLGGPAALSFPSTKQGWAVCVSEPGAGNQLKAIMGTSDGGDTWTAVAATPLFDRKRVAPNEGLSEGGYPTGVFFLSDGHGWLYGQRMPIYRTADGGRHWTPIARPNTSAGEIEPLQVVFVDSRHGYALIGSINRQVVRLLQTADGGHEWYVVQQWTTAS